MAQERETATRITSLNELLEIVTAIRAMAASQMQQALRSLEAIRGYSQQIRGALSEAAGLLPPDGAIEAVVRPKKSGLSCSVPNTASAAASMSTCCAWPKAR